MMRKTSCDDLDHPMNVLISKRVYFNRFPYCCSLIYATNNHEIYVEPFSKILACEPVLQRIHVARRKYDLSFLENHNYKYYRMDLGIMSRPRSKIFVYFANEIDMICFTWIMKEYEKMEALDFYTFPQKFHVFINIFSDMMDINKITLNFNPHILSCSSQIRIFTKETPHKSKIIEKGKQVVENVNMVYKTVVCELMKHEEKLRKIDIILGCKEYVAAETDRFEKMVKNIHDELEMLKTQQSFVLQNDCVRDFD